jgi:hypothetical protein
MFLAGLAILAVSLIALWLCLPGPDGKMKRFLRGGLDLVAVIAITAGLGVSVVLMLASLAL